MADNQNETPAGESKLKQYSPYIIGTVGVVAVVGLLWWLGTSNGGGTDELLKPSSLDKTTTLIEPHTHANDVSFLNHEDFKRLNTAFKH